MSLASWLRAFLPKRRQAASEGAVQSPLADQPQTTETPRVAAEVIDSIDNGVRMHIAAQDPEFPTKREAAITTIIKAIDVVAQTHGFTKKPQSWAKTGDLGTVSIHLQRSRYGFDCHINLGFQPLAEGRFGPWEQDDFVPLGGFFPSDATGSDIGPDTGPDIGVDDTGTLTYLDVYEDADSLEIPMQVLSDQALPWLLAHLTNPNAHSLPFSHVIAPASKSVSH